jgi:DNA repair protein RadC
MGGSPNPIDWAGGGAPGPSFEQGRMPHARRAAVLLDMACSAADIPLCIGYAGNNGYTCHHPDGARSFALPSPVIWIREWSTPRNVEGPRALLAGMYGDSGDECYSASLRLAQQQLAMRPERTKVIIYLLDGRPTDEPSDAVRDTVEHLRRAGILVIGLFVGGQGEIRYLRDIFGADDTIGERPIERLACYGSAALSDAEIIAALLCGSAGGTNSVVLAQQLIVTFGGWHGLQRASLAELQSVPGLGRTRAARLKAALEIGRRLVLAPPGERLQIRSPGDAAQLLIAELGHREQEHLATLLLDTKNRVQALHTVYIGSLNASMVRVGEVFKEAIRRNSAALIVSHNHPSGDCTPSPEDVLVTREIIAAGKLIDVDVLDHLIVSPGRFVSMRERGLGFSS